jgi:hypothetical protein
MGMSLVPPVIFLRVYWKYIIFGMVFYSVIYALLASALEYGSVALQCGVCIVLHFILAPFLLPVVLGPYSDRYWLVRFVHDRSVGIRTASICVRRC